VRERHVPPQPQHVAELYGLSDGLWQHRDGQHCLRGV
jgi:hypothetical protein